MQRFYDLLDSKATDADDGGRVYEGFTTQDFYTLDLPQPYYTKLTRQMQQMGCMTQLQRGSRSVPSRWALHHRPNEELYGMIDPRESNIDSLKSQVTQYTSVVDQKMRVMRKDQSNLANRLQHLQVAVMQQASMLAQLADKLGVELVLEDITIPEEELESPITPEVLQQVTEGAE